MEKFVRKLDSKAKFFDPVDRDCISAAEAKLKIKFPSELIDFLRQSNGVVLGGSVQLIYSVSDMIEQTLVMREFVRKEEYMPFDRMLLLGEEGGGDLYFYPIYSGELVGEKLFCWNHENDSRKYFAINLKEYFEEAIYTEEDDVEEIKSVFRDSLSGVTLCFESNLLRLIAISSKGKLMWNRYIYEGLNVSPVNPPTVHDVTFQGDEFEINLGRAKFSKHQIATGALIERKY